MSLSTLFSTYFLSYSSPFYWRDLIEIAFFSATFYAIAQWLKKDRQKNLLLYFYSYCAIAFAAHLFHLTTISYTFFLFAPVVAMIFILMHQETLQKNFVTLKNITPAQHVHLDWLELLIRTSLLAINKKKSITCIIEQNDNLTSLLQTPLQFHASLEQGLLEILLASPTFDEQKMIWATTRGNLIGINAIWKKEINKDTLERTIHKLPQWKQEAIFFTSRVDAIVFHINPTTRTFDIVLQGMIIDNMHATKTIELIKKYVVSKKTQTMKAVNHEKIYKKRSSEQRTP